MEFWNHIYENFDPVAISIGFFNVHWYGIMYVTALLLALYMGKYFVKKFNLPITNEHLDSFFLYIEIGVVLGARLGYVLFYMPNNSYYLSHPWEMFNPMVNGQWVGISGFSYHGALLGAVLGTMLFAYRFKYKFFFIMDLVALSVPLGYVFGRIGNFFNQELYGRATDVPWGIYVDGVLRHPSQLYEAFLEGIVLFVVIYAIKLKQSFEGQLIAVYVIGYSLARFVAEFYREADFQIGYLSFGLTMGQNLSFGMMLIGVIMYITLQRKTNSRF